MTDFLEFEENKKTIKKLNLEDLSIENLKEYILELEEEIIRVKGEIELKNNSIVRQKNTLNNYFDIFKPLKRFWNRATCPSDSLRLAFFHLSKLGRI